MGTAGEAQTATNSVRAPEREITRKSDPLAPRHQLQLRLDLHISDRDAALQPYADLTVIGDPGRIGSDLVIGRQARPQRRAIRIRAVDHRAIDRHPAKRRALPAKLNSVAVSLMVRNLSKGGAVCHDLVRIFETGPETVLAAQHASAHREAILGIHQRAAIDQVCQIALRPLKRDVAIDITPPNAIVGIDAEIEILSI